MLRPVAGSSRRWYVPAGSSQVSTAASRTQLTSRISGWGKRGRGKGVPLEGAAVVLYRGNSAAGNAVVHTTGEGSAGHGLRLSQGIGLRGRGRCAVATSALEGDDHAALHVL